MTDRGTEITLTFFGGNVSYRVDNDSEIYLGGLPKTEYNLLLGLAKLRYGWILPYDDAYKIVYDGDIGTKLANFHSDEENIVK